MSKCISVTRATIVFLVSAACFMVPGPASAAPERESAMALEHTLSYVLANLCGIYTRDLMNKDIPLESKRATARAYYSTLFVVWLRSNVGHGDQGAKVFDLSGFLRAFAILREKLNLQELIVRDDPLGWEGHPEKVKKEEVIAAFGADDIFRYFRWALSVTKDDVTYRALVDKFQKQLDASVEE